MIDIFVPEKIGPHQIIAKRVLGFDISKTHVYCTQILLQGTSIVVEKFFQEQLDIDGNKNYLDRVSVAIKNIIGQADKFDEIRSSLSSASVIFKELQFPFNDHEKIALIVKYEVEPFLPFSITDAIVDFIVTKNHTEQAGVDVLAAAVQKKYIAEHLSYFEHAGCQVNTVSVDLFDLYGLYKAIPDYAHLNQLIALIAIEFNAIRILYIADGQLKFTRTLPKGIISLAKSIAQELSISNAQALEDMIRFGFEKSDDVRYKNAINNGWNPLITEISFTLQSFVDQTSTHRTLNKIFLLGRGAEINGIESFIARFLNVPCQFFDANVLLKIPSFKIKTGAPVPRANIMSLSTAFASQTTEKFNLRKEEFTLSHLHDFYKKFFTAIGLFLFIFTVLIGHIVWQKNRLNNAIKTMERSVVTALHDRQLTEERSFEKSIQEAQEKIDQEEELWFGFSQQRRFSFLKILQNLSSSIDRDSLGLNLKKLLITSNEILLDGSVKGFEELKTLEKELHASKLFTSVPVLQELKFNEKLQLKKNGDESV